MGCNTFFQENSFLESIILARNFTFNITSLGIVSTSYNSLQFLEEINIVHKNLQNEKKMYETL